jgi:hypothetical protein
MSTSRALGTMRVVGLLATGCGKFYWHRPGGTAPDFAKDSGECARPHALYMSANKDYGIVQADLYKSCLRTRGWLRAQSPDPPANWFRRIEREETVRLDFPTAPASPARSAFTSTATGADNRLYRLALQRRQ